MNGRAAAVQVNAIAPGYVRTDVTEALQNDPARYQSILERIPAGRWGEIDDFKGPVVFPGFVRVRFRQRRDPGCRWRLDGSLSQAAQSRSR